MFHYTRYQDIRTVTNRIHLQLFSHEVFIHQYGMFLLVTVYDAYKFLYLLVGVCDPHALTAQYVRRTNQYGISETACNFFCLLRREHGTSRCPWYPCLLQDLIKELPVFRSINISGIRTPDGYSHLHKALGESYGSLSSELYHSAVRMLDIHYVLHILRCERLKIQFIRNIKIR